MTWAVTHEIDANGALADVDLRDPKDRMAVVVTLIGLEGTVRTDDVRAPRPYAEGARVGHRFVDVTHRLPDGRMGIDYSLFHDTVEARELDAAE